MKHEPIKIPDDIAALYEHDGQGPKFDDAFRKIVAVPADQIPLYKEAEKKPKGRPKKDKTEDASGI